MSAIHQVRRNDQWTGVYSPSANTVPARACRTTCPEHHHCQPILSSDRADKGLEPLRVGLAPTGKGSRASCAGLRLSKELRQRHIEAPCQFVEEVHRGISPLVLEFADIGAIHLRICRQSFLGNPAFQSETPEIPRKKRPPVHGATPALHKSLTHWL